MTVTCLRATLAFFLVASFPSAASWAQKQAKTSDSDAIKQSVSSFIDHFNRHDPHQISMVFAEDADLTNMRGNTYQGRQEIEQLYASLFSGRLKNTHRIASVKSIRFLTSEIASVDCDWEMTGTKAEDGSEIPLRKGILALVMTRHNGDWLITVYHEPEFALSPGK